MKSKTFIHKHRRLIGFLFAGLALLIAVAYFIIVPSEAAGSTGIQKVILLYAHSLCWLLLCMASVLWGMRKYHKLSVYSAYAAAAVYALFMVSLLITKI